MRARGRAAQQQHRQQKEGKREEKMKEGGGGAGWTIIYQLVVVISRFRFFERRNFKNDFSLAKRLLPVAALPSQCDLYCYR